MEIDRSTLSKQVVAYFDLLSHSGSFMVFLYIQWSVHVCEKLCVILKYGSLYHLITNFQMTYSILIWKFRF